MRKPGREYLRVEWVGAPDGEPILLFSELDEERLEVRKVEMYRDGRAGWAGPSGCAAGSELAYVATPPLDVIASDPEFLPTEITGDEFEDIWIKALGNRTP